MKKWLGGKRFASKEVETEAYFKEFDQSLFFKRYKNVGISLG